jgi:hypothetical protein
MSETVQGYLSPERWGLECAFFDIDLV